MLSFSPESVCLPTIQKYKDSNIRNINFACCFIWVQNLVFYNEGKTQPESVRAYTVLEVKPEEEITWKTQKETGG